MFRASDHSLLIKFYHAARNTQASQRFYFLALPYSFFCIDCCIPHRFFKFSVSSSVQTNSDHSRTCSGQAIAVSRPSESQSFCTLTTRMPCTPFSVFATVIVRIQVRQSFSRFSFLPPDPRPFLLFLSLYRLLSSISILNCSCVRE